MKTIIITLLLIPAIAFAGQLPCGKSYEKRIVKGTAPTATMLYAKIKKIESGAWKKGFWEETFSYIGDVHTRNGKVYKIGFLTTIWGQACRATHRLFIFGSDNSYLGQYDGITDPPVKISGSVLYFPYDAQVGNSLDLENGPPAQAWLDGQNPGFAR
jgi:hypothetical protein